MSFASLLNLTCTVQTSTPAQDSSGQKIASWADTYTSVKCRLEPISPGLQRTPSEIFDNATHTLFMLIPIGTIVTKNMRIVLGGQNYIILDVQKLYDTGAQHHLEIILELIT